ncbi:MAG: cell envelope integrity protein TolA [Proteobacteria bacterium]|nr:cell envelope integrity protein TolA [Pseudomonadota bacterium]
MAQVVKPAFKYEVAPSAMKQPEQIGMPLDRMKFKIIVATSILVHLMIVLIRPDLFWSGPKINFEEVWDVDVDFMGDIALKSPKDTALPNADKSEEEAVPKNLLPQLPKKFEIEAQKKAPDELNPDEIDKKADESIAEEKKVSNDEKIEIKKTEEDANKVALDDLRKRLAVEKLKQENKVDEKMKAQKDAIARLKDEKSKDSAESNSGSSGGAVGLIRSNAYGNALQSAVARNFNLPENFRYTQSKMSVPLTVVINDSGDLVSLKLNGSSGSEVYDKAVLTAVKNSVPLPKPPTEFAGKEIQINFRM